jgi:hypothetical protein
MDSYMKRTPLLWLARFIGLSLQPVSVFAQEDLAGQRRLCASRGFSAASAKLDASAAAAKYRR